MTLSLLKNRKVWQNVVKMVHAGEMPPKGRPRPTAGRDRGVPAHGQRRLRRADRNAKPDPGRVTIRRLNRAEYNNTIRDLVGVDFNPAEDFPSDDVGYGFDNIGDVLSLSPVLMERYLAAAESIAQRAIARRAAQAAACAGHVGATSNPRRPKVRANDSGRSTNAGNVCTRRTRLTHRRRVHLPRHARYARTDGDKEPVKVALLRRRQGSRRRSKSGPTARRPAQSLEVKVETLQPGDHRVVVSSC